MSATRITDLVPTIADVGRRSRRMADCLVLLGESLYQWPDAEVLDAADDGRDLESAVRAARSGLADLDAALNQLGWRVRARRLGAEGAGAGPDGADGADGAAGTAPVGDAGGVLQPQADQVTHAP